MSKHFLFFIVIFFSFLAFSCKNGEIEEFFKENGYSAEILNIEYSGKHTTGKSGIENIPSDKDYSIYFNVSNPNNIILMVEAEFESKSVSANISYDNSTKKIILTYPSSVLSKLNKTNTNDISAKIVLKDKSKNVESIESIEDIFDLKLKCNDPPPKIENALSEIIGVTETLLIAVDIPTLQSDVCTLKIEANGTIHEFPIVDGVPTNDSKGWTISTTKPMPTESAYKTGNLFSSVAGTPYFITTDFSKIKSKKDFPIKITLIDTEGLESEVYKYNSHQKIFTYIEGTTSLSEIELVFFELDEQSFSTDAPITATIKAKDKAGNDVTALLENWSIEIFDNGNNITTLDNGIARVTVTNNVINIVCPKTQTMLKIFASAEYKGIKYGNSVNMGLY